MGAISGATSAIGTFAINLSATNANGTGTAVLTLTVQPATPPVFTSADTVTAQEGTPFSFQVTAVEGVTRYSATGLPTGLTNNAATGLISGTPTTAGAFTVALQAANVRGTTFSTLTLTIVGSTPVVTLTTDASIANPVQGIAGSFTLTRVGDLSQPLTVTFTIKGSGENGVDYKLLTTTKTIKAGKSTKRINVTAYAADGISADSKKTIKLTLQPSSTYAVGASSTAKVKIFYNP